MNNGKKIELTELEKRMLNHFLVSGGYSVMGHSTSENDAMMSVITKAEKLMDELDAYEETGEDLLRWFYSKIYNAPYPADDSDIKMLID